MGSARTVSRIGRSAAIRPPADGLTDVTLIACVVCLSSTASIVQQIYYACEWRIIKTVAWQQANLSVDMPAVAFGPLSTGFNLALFEIQFVCYSISALLILFWFVLANPVILFIADVT